MADGTIQIDLDVNDNSGATFASFEQKAKDSGSKAHDGLKKEFDKEIVAKLDAQAKEAGINNFSRLLKDLPKEKQVELLAKAKKGEVIDFDREIEKIPAKVVTNLDLNDNASVKMKSLHEESGKLSRKFGQLKDVMLGTFAGNLIISGIGSITSGLKGAMQAGMEFNKEQDTMKTVWHSLTEEAPNDGKVLIDYINQMSQHSIYAADSINKMAQSFYHVHSNVEETKNWTNSFVALGSTMHMTNDQLSEAGEMFAKIVAGGKASQEDLNIMINRFPMFGEAIQQATGKSMAQLQAMSQKGQLTATQFEQAIDFLGKKYAGGTAEAMTSMQGMSMYLKSRLDTLMGDVTKSSFNMSKSATSALQRITSDENMQKYAKAISGAMSVALGWLSKLIEYVSNHGNDIVSILGSIVSIAGELLKGAWDVFAGTIKTIAKAFGGLSGDSKKSGDSLKQVADALKTIASHKEAIKVIGELIAGAFAVKKVAGFVGAVKEVNDTLKITSGISSFKHQIDLAGGSFKYLKIQGVRSFRGIKSAASSTKNGIMKIFEPLKSAFKWTAKIVTNGAKLAISGLKKSASGIASAFKWTAKMAWSGVKMALSGIKVMAKGVANAVSWTAKLAWSGVKTALRGIVKFAKEPDKYIKYTAKMAWNGVKRTYSAIVSGAKATGRAIGNAFNSAKNATVKAFKAIKDTSSKTFNAIKEMPGKVSNAIKNAFNKASNDTKTAFQKMKKSAQNAFNSMKNGAKKDGEAIKNAFESAKNGVKKAMNGMKNAAVKSFEAMKKGAVSAGNGMKVAFNWAKTNPIFMIITAITLVVVAFTELYKHNKKFRDFVNGLVKWAKKAFDGVVKWFTKLPKEIGKLFKNIMNFFKNNWKEILLFIANPIAGGIALAYKHIKPFREFVDGVVKFVGNVFKSMGSVINDVFNDIGKFISASVKFISNIINTVINGISSTWSSVWKGISSFFSGIWNGISNFASSAIHGISSTISNVIHGISGIWKDVWNGISSFFSGLWDGIVNTVEKAIDKIKSVINGVKDVVGGIGKAIGGLIPKFATGGIVGYNDQLVMVNDGQGADWKELIHLPTGEMMMSDQRNALMPLPIGTRIYSGQDTKEIMKKQGIQNYENGGVVGQPYNLADTLSSTVNGIKAGMNSIGATPVVTGAGMPQMTVQQGNGVDLSGDTHLTISLDGNVIATKTWPKIKMLQNLDVQQTGQARGAIYGR